jgi:cyclase
MNFGSQCVVVAIDAKYVDNDWFVFLVGGRVKTNIRLFEWANEAEQRGAGEILFTSMDHDGTKNGFACLALEKLSQAVNIPIIASGGAGKIEHFYDVFKSGNIDAALAASVFHFNEIGLDDLKIELKNNNIPIRL